MAKATKTVKRTMKQRRATERSAQPDSRDLIRKPDITAFAKVRFHCAIYIKVTHPEYMPHEVMALVKQGQAQLDPIAPGQVGTLILDGFPYTVLGYYTLSEQEAEYERGPDGCSFHGPFYEFYRREAATFRDMVNSKGQDFEEARRLTRRLRENMAKRQKRRRVRKALRT